MTNDKPSIETKSGLSCGKRFAYGSRDRGCRVGRIFLFDLGRVFPWRCLKDNRDYLLSFNRNTFCRIRSVVRPDLCGRDGALASGAVF